LTRLKLTADVGIRARQLGIRPESAIPLLFIHRAAALCFLIPFAFDGGELAFDGEFLQPSRRIAFLDRLLKKSTFAA